MLHPKLVMNVITAIKEKSTPRIILYTAKVDHIPSVKAILQKIDGLTVTLHEPEDVSDFIALAAAIAKEPEFAHKSLRVNIFANITTPRISGWVVKNNIKWKKNAPLPQGEVFRRF